MYEAMHEWCGTWDLPWCVFAWDMSYSEITCERC